jgi:dienelactone hydrolase
MTRLRILALHSFRTSGAALEKQLFAFSNVGGLIKAHAEVCFVNAPYCCTDADEAKIAPMVRRIFPRPYHEWFNANKDEQGRMVYDRIDATLRFLAEYMKEHGPFDGLMGFSQGGSVVHLIAMLASSGQLPHGMPRPGFVMLFSCRRSRHFEHLELMETAEASVANRCKVPALIVWNAEDDHVRPEETECAIATFDGERTTLIFHASITGHKIADLHDSKADLLRNFMEARLCDREAAIASAEAAHPVVALQQAVLKCVNSFGVAA